MSGFRKDMPACLKLYLTSIRCSSRSETKSKGATDQELTGQEIKGKRKKSPEVVPVRSKIRRSERSPDVASGRSMRIGGKRKSKKRHLGQTSNSAPSVKRPKKGYRSRHPCAHL
ncbi:PREDICTED: uncharacterized protein LOC109468115 [Branchiostoma belcheri]|uniref:Uncharacterized protein LOC109468115 n=1 Tax=Branchiostoma belcheri TaxID=7741 RepID=A0A6P4YJG4_BRABE|nr:PREDICTED: uncharacterized protein LOC109468115 [Branchiostoma belcheri]